MVSPTPLKNALNIWERGRRRFRINMNQFNSKSEIKEYISNRQNALDKIAKGQKTLKFEEQKFSPTRAKSEIKALESYKKSIEKTDSFEKVTSFKSIKVNSGKSNTYIKSYHEWNQDERRTIQANINLPVKSLVNIMDAKYNRAYTASSISTMKSRLKRGIY